MTAEGAVLSFPDRMGLRTPRAQWDTLRHMKSAELLAALMTKYPDCTFASDELRAAQGMNVHVQMVARSEWKMIPFTPLAEEAAK